MRPLRWLLVVVLLIASVPAVQADENACGTSPELNEWLRELGAWSNVRAREIMGKGLSTSAATVSGDIFVVPSDETNTPFRRPFDLAGRTLIFQRQGETGFAMRNVALEWDEARGAAVPLQGGEPHATVDLDFDFPFFDRSVTTVYVTANHGIFLSTPVASQLKQYGDAELVAIREPVIAPFLSTRASRLGPLPTVYVRKDANSVAITWTSGDRYNVRATLFRSGEIRFSYERVTSAVAAASVLITSGSEPWRSERTVVAAAEDAAGDLRTPVPAAISGMLDITGVSVDRVAELDLFEVRIRTAAPIVAANIPANEFLQFIVAIPGLSFRYLLYGDGRERYLLPVWGWNSASPAARADGNELVLTFVREHVPHLAPVTFVVTSYRGVSSVDSTSGLAVALPEPAATVRTDFSATDEAVFHGVPIMQAFTVPVLSVYRVWEQVKAADPSLKDSDVDGVAIYQNFLTDLVTYAGAYSTGGNAGVRGLHQSDYNAPFRPRTPALMHMNAIGYGHNRTSRGASRVVLHEIGHRWLLFTSLMENGTNGRTLNPVSAHPAQYVDTRAAFNVYTETDTSVMGGGFFTDHGSGTFSSGPYGPYGYSWLDLYLMGLAAPDEVPPMFYIADSTPKLGGEYYAPPGQTYKGTRRDFTIQQVIEGTGTRWPAYPETQRQFRVVFVVVTDPDREATVEETETVHHYRDLMEEDFRTATNGRGGVTTTLAPPPAGPRRRAVGR